MTTRRYLRFTALMILGSALPVLAHHSVTAEFDPNKRITLKGTVTKVDWQNPHIFFHIDVKDASGKITSWELQSLPPAFFRGSGLTRQKILADTEEVTVTAYPAKDGTAAYGYLLTLSYPDGRSFNLSREGVTAPPAK